MPKYWEIVGHEGDNEIFRSPLLSTWQYSENRIRVLMQVLTAKYTTFQEWEIIGAFARKNSKGSNDLLNVTKVSSGYMCGNAPLFTARIVSK